MRRLVALVLSGIGTFLIVLALLVHFLVPAMAVKFPLNVSVTTTLQASGVSYFNEGVLKEFNGATVRATNTTRGVGGTSSVAVWKQFTYVYDETNKLVVEYSTAQLAFDRRSGALTNCCGTAFGTNTHVPVSGQGPVFPFGTQKTTYQVFNANLLKAAPARYSGEVTIDGLQTYKFVQQVPATKIANQAVPGSLIGMKNTPLVTLGEFYQATNTWWVDPTTGITVQVEQKEHLNLQNGGGIQELNLFQGDLRPLPSAVPSSVKNAESKDSLVSVVSSVGPLVAGLVGILVLAAGILLYLTSRDTEQVSYGRHEATGRDLEHESAGPEPEHETTELAEE